MLAIGRGLMAEPKLLILDEPSLGLSPLLVEELFALIKRINAEGSRLLLVEQNVVQSLEVAERAYILDNGRFVLEGSAADIRQRSRAQARLSRNVSHGRCGNPALSPRPASPSSWRQAFMTRSPRWSPTQAGFATLYVSGAAIAYTRLGRPDIGLVSMSEVADTLALIRDRVDAHLIVDADTGYGNALNVVRTVRCSSATAPTAYRSKTRTFPSVAAISTERL